MVLRGAWSKNTACAKKILACLSLPRNYFATNFGTEVLVRKSSSRASVSFGATAHSRSESGQWMLLLSSMIASGFNDALGEFPNRFWSAGVRSMSITPVPLQQRTKVGCKQGLFSAQYDPRRCRWGKHEAHFSKQKLPYQSSKGQPTNLC